MKLATIRTATGTRAVRIDEDTAVDLGADDLVTFLRRPGWQQAAAAVDGERHGVDELDYAPVVVAPEKVVCVGLNYRSHILEMGHELPAHPTLFAKFREALIGAHDDIVLPPDSDSVDWEAELTLVIGTRVRRATRDQAASAIAGFTVANDVSMRDWQYRSIEFLQGKTWEHATPVGPWLVTPDELGGTAPDLAIGCDVDGVTRQASRTSELVFSAADLVAYASQFVTLEPGDLLLTGTPGGVGHGMHPPTYLHPGEVLRTTIQGIGELRNRCVAESA